MPDDPRSPFAYVIVRAVPRMERGEFVNCGIVLFSRPMRFLGARVWLDRTRLAAMAPDCEPYDIESQLEAIVRVAEGAPDAGPIARLSKAERFHWLSSPTSTVVQRSEIHTGLTADPAATLEHLFLRLVRD